MRGRRPPGSPAAWLADSRRLVIRRHDGIGVVDADTGTVRPLVTVGGQMIGKSVGVSRDNRWITYTETRHRGRRVDRDDREVSSDVRRPTRTPSPAVRRAAGASACGGRSAACGDDDVLSQLRELVVGEAERLHVPVEPCGGG